MMLARRAYATLEVKGSNYLASLSSLAQFT